MSMPKSEIIIGKGGKITIEGIDKSDQLFKLDDLSRTVYKDSNMHLVQQTRDHVEQIEGRFGNRLPEPSLTFKRQGKNRGK